MRSDHPWSSETGSHQASTNRAIDAVKPCRKFLPPIGPISPRAVESRQRKGPELSPKRPPRRDPGPRTGVTLKGSISPIRGLRHR